MNFLFPILAAVFQAGSITIDKVGLSLRRITFKTYTSASFQLAFVIALLVFWIVRPELSWQLFANYQIPILLILIGATALSNLIFYRALDDDKLGEVELFDVIRTFPIILISSILLSSERNFNVVVPALVASMAVIWSHWHRGHFKIARYTLPLAVASVTLEPIRALSLNFLLVHWHPVALELIRTAGVAMILAPLFARHRHKVSLTVLIVLICSNVLTTASWLFLSFSYQQSGIVYTTLILLLQPLLIYLASVFYLKEKFKWKQAVAFAIVLIMIGVAQVSQG